MHFPPGSEFLYFKVYVGPATADHVLKIIFDGIKELGSFPWFFIRYGDPKWHIRLRLKGEKDGLLRNILPVLSECLDQLTQQGLVEGFQLDTYHRESDRYGGTHGIEVAEQIFGVDSYAVCQLLGLLQRTDSETHRWKFAILGVDDWLKDFGLTYQTRFSLMKTMSSGYHEEFQSRKIGLYHEISRNYRAMRLDLEALLFNQNHGSQEFAEAKRIFHSRSVQSRPLISEYLNLEESHLLSRPLLDIIPSIVHMFSNRIFKHDGRKQELVIYEFLKRLYASHLKKK